MGNCAAPVGQTAALNIEGKTPQNNLDYKLNILLDALHSRRRGGVGNAILGGLNMSHDAVRDGLRCMQQDKKSSAPAATQETKGHNITRPLCTNCSSLRPPYPRPPHGACNIPQRNAQISMAVWPFDCGGAVATSTHSSRHMRKEHLHVHQDVRTL